MGIKSKVKGDYFNMAKITKTLYQCDRCLSISEDAPKSCTDYKADYSLKLHESYASFGGVTFEWNLLCDECDKYMEKLVKIMKDDQTESRSKNE